MICADSGGRSTRFSTTGYSQLKHVFAQLIRLGLMDETALAGLADEKRADIRHMLSFFRRRDEPVP
jgi:hypothetical protein